MSQSIRISSGLGPILQHTPNNTSSSSSSCKFLSMEQHTCMEVGFPITTNRSSVKECSRKRAAWISVVSNRNHPRFLLTCTATLKSSSSNVDLDEDGKGSINKGKGNKYDDPLKVMLLGVSQAWGTILSKFDSVFRPEKVNKGVVVIMILRDDHDPIAGLKVLLDVSRAWRMFLSLTFNELYDAKGFYDYGESYIRKARMKGGTNKGKHNSVKNPPPRITTRLSILRLLADLNDPNDGLEVMLGALEVWRMLFLSKELNDSEGYLQKEIFAIRDLSQRSRILVSNRNGEHDEAKNPPSQITHVLDLLKLVIDNFEDPSDAGETMLEAFRYVAADKADLNYIGLDGEIRVKPILVNIFAGIMKCDIIASGIVNAAKQVALKVPMALLLEGTTVEQGKSILKTQENMMALITAEDLDDAAVKVVKAVDLDDAAFEAVKAGGR